MSSVLLALLLYLIYTFFSNSGQASALKVAYILKVLGSKLLSSLTKKPMSARKTIIFRFQT